MRLCMYVCGADAGGERETEWVGEGEHGGRRRGGDDQLSEPLRSCFFLVRFPCVYSQPAKRRLPASRPLCVLLAREAPTLSPSLFSLPPLLVPLRRRTTDVALSRLGVGGWRRTLCCVAMSPAFSPLAGMRRCSGARAGDRRLLVLLLMWCYCVVCVSHDGLSLSGFPPFIDLAPCVLLFSFALCVATCATCVVRHVPLLGRRHLPPPSPPAYLHLLTPLSLLLLVRERLRACVPARVRWCVGVCLSPCVGVSSSLSPSSPLLRLLLGSAHLCQEVLLMVCVCVCALWAS